MICGVNGRLKSYVFRTQLFFLQTVILHFSTEILLGTNYDEAMFFIVWKLIPGLYGQPPEKYEATMALIAGPLAFNFWFFEVLIGMLIPFLLLINRRTLTPFGVTMAGLFCTVGIFFMRYDLIIAGQIVPMRESASEGPFRLLQYFPSLAEMAIVAAAIAFCLFLYTLAEKFLPMEGGHRH